ncbi:MAG: hypothetical protein ACLFWM_04970 [Actinomycetota bacterium]
MGDAACWLDRVCLDCNRFIEADEEDEGRCPGCGSERATALSDRP